MTPLRGFFKKILGGTYTPAPAPTATDAQNGRSAPVPDAPPHDQSGHDEGPRSGRRRGSRGGRGRGGGTASATAEVRAMPPAPAPPESPSSRGGRGRGRGDADGAPPAATESRSYAWTDRGGAERGETEEQARQRREQASRQRRGRSSFRPYRENLDAPLPEDIAFRSGPEGGDRSILPARRRRGTGLRDTERVIVGGARTLSGWSRPFVAPPEPTELPTAITPAREAGAEERAATPAARASTRARAARVAEPAILLDDDLDDDDQLDEHDEDRHDADGGNGVATQVGRVDLDADANEAEAIEDTEDGAPRRRRGRRGGRGRRRPGTSAEDGAAAREPAIAALPDENRAFDNVDEPEEIDRSDAPFAGLRDEDADDERDADYGAESDEGDYSDAVESATARPSPSRRAVRAPRAVATVDPSALPQAFAELGVGERTLQALARYGFTTPTPIQVRAIPALLTGRDVVGVAQTGSGKTIAFGVPMVERLDPELAEVQAIVLVPTRELASQVLEVLRDLAAGFGLEAVGILGGHSLAGDFKALERRPAIVVGTPGRVIDHLQRGTLSLRHVHYAILDEADQMLDIGFLPDIRRILSRTPKRRQTALFSATMPSTIRRLVWQFMDDPETVTVDPELATVETTEQVYFEVATRDKARGLRELVERELKGRTLVFCKMKRGVDRLEADLARQGVRVGALHGDMDQRRRDRVVQDFREGALDVLIATNVAARGLDIPEITHVVNYDVPQNPEEYVHRIGRTGRAGRDGKAITFVSEWDMREWDAILEVFGARLHREELALYS